MPMALPMNKAGFHAGIPAALRAAGNFAGFDPVGGSHTAAIGKSRRDGEKRGWYMAG